MPPHASFRESKGLKATWLTYLDPLQGHYCPSPQNEDMGVVLVSCWCNKLPQTYCLRIAQMYYLAVLELRSPKSLDSGLKIKVLTGLVPSEGSVGKSGFLPFPATHCPHSLTIGPLYLHYSEPDFWGL